ncbi:glycosyltransferase [Cognatishimia sp. SS12]|uniref:glycosyltransferase n=1 Tax=Cognatishimia sp. SS12 TaxID=2979465 RepID=UPI00233132D8|nr:glycosyltransferase [Cognatishimia sp. SS12]MDC0738084.1 glycosyltransferase [Cognatishimia sp. SS12]
MQIAHSALFHSAVPNRSAAQIGVARHLIETGAIQPWQLFFARKKQEEWDATLTEVLRGEEWIDEDTALEAAAVHFDTQVVNLNAAPPDPTLAQLLTPEFCLRHSVLPWVAFQGGDDAPGYILATSRPEYFDDLRAELPEALRTAQMVLAPEQQIQAQIAAVHRADLTTACEARVAPHESCRDMGQSRLRRCLLFLMGLTALMYALWQDMQTTFAVLTAIAVVMQLTSVAMKISAFFASRGFETERREAPPGSKLPKISVLVPLYHEKEIAGALVRRLSALTYPKILLDVVLILEEHDTLTRDALSETTLPGWMRIITVPDGSGLTTKPRALNYALDFCRGDIIGIWDAEDAPAPNQLEVIAAHFAAADPNVGCLQGVLDYYNPYTNWMSRCFTLEYSMWFRVILRGMARLGAAIPLGGTTLFMRRHVLEDVGRWDAQNVTEDADLGVRLCRYGYHTELAHTVTQEEANCQLHRWVKQRSRWLKGYMVTYFVHMRRPLSLMRALGARRFIGFNVIFLSTLAQFLLAPFVWSFWILATGVYAPWFGGLPDPVLAAVITLFIGVAFLDTALAASSMIGQGRDPLIRWAVTLPIYFPLATLGAYKALYELLIKPFYWDKTAHGQTLEGQIAEFSAVDT